MVDIMKSLVISRVEGFFSRYIFKTTFRALLLGIIFTSIVQSSSITTSIVVPLVGAGVLSLKRVYPYTLGANIGTTVTAIMASLVTQNMAAVAVAFSHLMFNICGIAIFLPLAKIPITIAKRVALLTIRSRLIPIGIIILCFFVIPLGMIYIFR
jgi:sodium-dependent phosphate cotransporter